MLISKQWLEQFVDLSEVSAEEFAQTVTIHSVEVEEVIDQAKALEHIVVGKVIKTEKHPDADSLQVCMVDIRDEKIPVVCGGSNVTEGMLVAMGNIGAKVRWHGEGDLVELKPTKIRGIESLGMICAASEIGLGELFPPKDEKEILDLSDITDAPLGTSLAQALKMNDILIDVDNKSMTHRPDLWGHYGMAREVAAMYGKELKEYKTKKIAEGSEIKIEVSVEEPELCPRYMAVAMNGITVEPSPKWMQAKLSAVGINPINNIVDLTNYLMLELGQPMHAFDAGKLAKKGNDILIIVKKAQQAEQFISLGGDDHELTEDMLMIFDAKQAVAIAGVKGGKNSGVTESTKTILFEAANFHPVSVRRTSTALGLRTDASARFEKSLDPTMVELALQRAVELVHELCPNAQVVSNVADESNYQLNTGPIQFDVRYLEKRTGVPIDNIFVKEVLQKLGFIVEEKNEHLLFVTIPTWRATKDVSIQEDLIEEITRMYGYHNIPISLPSASISPAPKDPLNTITRELRNLLALEAGFTEVYNYSFVSPELLQKIQVSTDQHIELDNPIAKDRPLLRRSLIPNMLENVEANSHRFSELALFEIGKTYIQELEGEHADHDSNATLPRQDEYLAMVYSKKGNATPFFELSAALSQLADRLGISFRLEPNSSDSSMIHPTRHASIFLCGFDIGNLAELHPKVAGELGIDERVALLELNITSLLQEMKPKVAYTPLPEYPAVLRDIAIIVDASVEHAKVQKAILGTDNHIVCAQLFDVYQGEHVEFGKKSMAYAIQYRSKKGTLTSKEVEEMHAQVLKKLEEKFSATLR